MSNIFITVLIPCKNANRKYIYDAINSVYSQTTPLWNLMIVDDHSDRDETLIILNELRNYEDDRVSVLKNDSTYVTGAINTGLKKSKTPYICTLHCDDILAENAIEILNKYIKKYPDIDYFHSSRSIIDKDGNFISDILLAKETFSLEDFKNCSPVKHLHCWKIQSSLKIGGMDESLSLHGADDYDFTWSMAEAKFTLMNGNSLYQDISLCIYLVSQ